MGITKIAWCDRVWNPITGCTKMSAGCAYCYASRMAPRLAGRFGYPADNPFRVTLHPEKLDEPRHWRKPARVFVDSMSDLFHPDVPDEFIRHVFSTMYLPENRKHTFMVLTKRAKRMQEMIHYAPDLGDHVWLGVSVENQAAADERIPLLLQTPAAVHFVSVEPMLEKIDLTTCIYDGVISIDALNGVAKGIFSEYPFPSPDLKAWPLDWAIAGCESGPQARPMELDWARSLRDQCQAAGTPFFFKQAMIDGKLVHMPELDGHVWNEFPERLRN